MEESINIAVAVFNRATYARVKTVISEMILDKDINPTLIAGSGLLDKEYGNGIDVIEKEFPMLKIVKLGYTSYKNNPCRVNLVSADIQKEISLHLKTNTYHSALVIADRFETLPAAMAFTYHGIPLMHLQGGEVTGNIDERVRHAVTKLSDYHFACTKLAKKYIVAMGEESNRVQFTGCPSMDLVRRHRIQRNTPKERYFMCVFHPDTETLEDQVAQTTEVLNAVIDYCAKYGAKCYWYWPNPDKGREQVLEVIKTAHKQYSAFLKKAINQPPLDFLKQLSGARFIMGNSSVGLRECTYIGVPSINIGDRQSIRERGINVIDVEPETSMIFQAMEAQNAVHKYEKNYMFGDGMAGKNIANFIKKFIWSKKGPITYPYKWEFKREHFEHERAKRHSYRDAGPRIKGRMEDWRAI